MGKGRNPSVVHSYVLLCDGAAIVEEPLERVMVDAWRDGVIGMQEVAGACLEDGADFGV